MLLFLRQQWQLQQLIIRAPVFAYSYKQARSLVNMKFKWVKDRTLDSVVAGEKALRAACELKDMLANSPDTCLPIYTLSRRRRQLGLGELKVSTFIRQYPTLFQELTRKNSDLLCFQLTEDALKLYQEELQILQQHEMDLILRLRKLLMITVERTLPLQTIDQLKWDMGLPHDYQQTLIPHYPQFFGLVRLSDDRIGLKLLHWDNQLAVSELEKNGGGYGSGHNLAFPVKFTRGFGLKRKCMAWLSEWQQLPYTSPFADPSNLDPRTDESEKRNVGVFHELLHLTITKRTERKNVSNLRKPLQLPQKFTKVFERHPGIFYISQKCATQTVMLREAYEGPDLVRKHPLIGLREKYASLMRTGMLNRSRGLYKKVLNDNEDGGNCKLWGTSEGGSDSNGLNEDYECDSDYNSLSEDDTSEEVDAQC